MSSDKSVTYVSGATGTLQVIDNIWRAIEFLKSAKGTAACRQTRKELASPLGGTRDTVPVLREFFKIMRDLSEVKTERLYYADSYLARVASRVAAISEDGLRVVLEQTVFYPTSGGQPHDVGLLNGIRVVDVTDDGNTITHVLADPNKGETAAGEIDWQRRYDHMQQHTGQHLLSAVFEELFHIPTLSFRMSEDASTIELGAKDLAAEQIQAVVTHATEAARRNPRVTVAFADADEVKGLRKASERQGSLRIVEIEGVDKSACGGTHVRQLAEVLPLQIREMDKVRGNMRVSFVCGNRALRRARTDFELLAKTAKTLAVPIDQVAAQAADLQQRLTDSEKRRRKLEEEAAAQAGLDLYRQTHLGQDGSRRMARSCEAIDDDTRAMAKAFASQPLAIILIHSADGVLLACSADSGVNAGQVLKQALTKYGARGGGSAGLAQGSLPDPAMVGELKKALGIGD